MSACNASFPMENKRRSGCSTIAAEFSTSPTKKTVPTYGYWRPPLVPMGYGESSRGRLLTLAGS